MVQISLKDVSVSFPLLHLAHRSLKKSVLANATGGRIVSNAKTVPSVEALSNLTLDIRPGDCVGLVGPNGAGKTTLLRTIAGVYEPTAGEIAVTGNITSLIEINVGFMPDMTGRENIRVRGMYMGMRMPEIEALASEIEVFTELGTYLDMPIRTYSAGMQLRLAFAIATSRQPDILLMDEWVMAGDATFIYKAAERMNDFAKHARILVLASHSDSLIKEWCNKVLYLDGGKVVASGETDRVLSLYQERRAATT